MIETLADERTRETIKGAFQKIDANRATLQDYSFKNYKRHEEASRATIDAGVDLAMCYLQYQAKCERENAKPVSMGQYLELIRQL